MNKPVRNTTAHWKDLERKHHLAPFTDYKSLAGEGGARIITKAEGVWLEDSEGRRYLDASGGAAVSVLGHGHRRVIEAIREQAANLAYAHTAFLANEPSEKLAEFLIDRAPPGFGRVFFCSGGSEATEAALKFARQYHHARGETERHMREDGAWARRSRLRRRFAPRRPSSHRSEAGDHEAQ